MKENGLIEQDASGDGSVKNDNDGTRICHVALTHRRDARVSTLDSDGKGDTHHVQTESCNEWCAPRNLSPGNVSGNIPETQ